MRIFNFFYFSEIDAWKSINLLESLESALAVLEYY